MPRLGENPACRQAGAGITRAASRGSIAKARLFNEVMVQKIIGEMIKLFFNRYLTQTNDHH